MDIFILLETTDNDGNITHRLSAHTSELNATAEADKQWTNAMKSRENIIGRRERLHYFIEQGENLRIYWDIYIVTYPNGRA